MKTGNRKASSLSIACAGITLVAAMIACGSPTPTGTPTQNSSSGPTPEAGNEVVCYPGITPGQTTKDQVIALLGDPASTEQEGINEILLYPTSLLRVFNTIIIQNQVVVLVDVVVGEDDAVAFSAIKARYGEPGQITYSSFLQGSMTYIFPDKGLSFVANEDLDIIFDKQCFLPMTLEEYMNTWGKDLPTEDPFIK
jgi:hypothetical protein